MSDIDIMWSRFNAYINNPLGVAGLMGNLQAESSLVPYRLQGDNTSGYVNSVKYTNDVNNGTISKSTFVNDSKGYGLAQWTTSDRKKKYYEFMPISTTSIGDLYRGIDYTIHELQTDYNSVWQALVNATSIREASNRVLHDYEKPKDQSEAVEIYRAQLSTDIYNQYSPIPPTPVPGASAPIWLLAQALRKI